MKWNRFIVENAAKEERLPTSRLLDTSQRSSSSASQRRPFALKSLEKIKINASAHSKERSLTQQENINDSAIKKMLSKVTSKNQILALQRAPESPKRQKSSPRKRDDTEQLMKLAQNFINEFQSFLKTFFDNYQEHKFRKQQQVQMCMRLSSKMQQSLSKYVAEHHTSLFRPNSPPKPSSTNNVPKSPMSKHTSRAIAFKNQMKNQKDCLKDAHASINQIHKILEDTPEAEGSKQRRMFARTSIRTTKNKKDRSIDDNSVEEIIQRSLVENRKSKSHLKARQALYQFNKALNNNNV